MSRLSPEEVSDLIQWARQGIIMQYSTGMFNVCAKIAYLSLSFCQFLHYLLVYGMSALRSEMRLNRFGGYPGRIR
jgi:hypothetical protein